MPQHVFIPLLCIRHNILDRVSMIKAFAYFRDYVFPAFSGRFFRLTNICVLFFKTSLTIFPCCGIVIKSTTWARSSTGRAFGSHPRGRGFDPLRVHQNNIIRTFCRLVMGSDLLFLLEKLKTGNEENRRTVDHAKVHLKTKKRTDISQT